MSLLGFFLSQQQEVLIFLVTLNKTSNKTEKNSKKDQGYLEICCRQSVFPAVTTRAMNRFRGLNTCNQILICHLNYNLSFNVLSSKWDILSLKIQKGQVSIVFPEESDCIKWIESVGEDLLIQRL